MNPLPFPEFDKIKKLKLFFIIGRSRSGTTLLRSMLDMHPNLMIPVECTFIMQLARKYGNIKKWNRQVIDEYIIDLQKTWLFTELKLNISILKQHLLQNEINLNYISVCKTVIFNTPVNSEKTNIIWLGDKNPSYSIHFNRLFKIFGAECKYIHLVRDYRDQFISVKNAGIELPDITVSTKRWVNSYKAVNRHAVHNNRQFLLVKYEDLVKNTETELQKVCAFLEINYEPGMLNFNQDISRLSEKYPDDVLQGIHQSLLEPVSTDKTGIWKTRLSKNEAGIADFIAGKTADKAGYERSDRRNPLKYFILSFPGIILFYFAYFSEKIMSLAPFSLYIKFSAGAYFGSIWNKYSGKTKR